MCQKVIMLTRGPLRRTLMLGADSNPSVVVKVRKNGSERGQINNGKDTCCTLRWADFITY